MEIVVKAKNFDNGKEVLVNFEKLDDAKAFAKTCNDFGRECGYAVIVTIYL